MQTLCTLSWRKDYPWCIIIHPQCNSVLISQTVIVDWPPPPGSTHEVIAVEAIASMPDSDCLKQWSSINSPPGSTHEVIAVEAITSMPDSNHLKQWSSIDPPPPRINTWGNHCWGDQWSLLRWSPHCLTVIASNSDHLNSDHWLTPQDQHMRWLLLRWSPQCLTAIFSTVIVDQPPTGSTHEAIAVEVIASMPDSDHLKQQSLINPPRINTWGNCCWGDCLITWQQLPQTVIISTAIINWPPQDQHMRWLLLRWSPQHLTVIVSTVIIDCPPRINTWGNHCWGDCLSTWQRSPQTVIVDWPPPRINTWGDRCWGDRRSTPPPLHFESLI